MTKLLLIDDDQAVRETLVMKLSGDYAVVAVDSRDAALPVLDAEPDVILMDRIMPGLGIEQFMDRVRERCPKANVVLMSGTHDTAETSRLGIRHFVAKFLDFPRLTQTLMNAML